MNRLFKIIKLGYKKSSKFSSYISKLLFKNSSRKPYSQKGINWLKYQSQLNGMYIQHAENEGEFCIPGTKYKADGYNKITKTVYEMYGCYWHGCRRCYDPKVYNKDCNKTMSELYTKTMKRESEIKKLGYNMVTIWEHDWDAICKKGENKIGWLRWSGGLIYGLIRRII